MVVEAVPFNFPRTGRMNVNTDRSGSLHAAFDYLNGHGALVVRLADESMFRLSVLDSSGCLDYLPEVLGEGVRTVKHLTADEVDALLVRISNLPR